MPVYVQYTYNKVVIETDGKGREGRGQRRKGREVREKTGTFIGHLLFVKHCIRHFRQLNHKAWHFLCKHQ